MRLSDVTWELGDGLEPFSQFTVLHRASGALYTAYVTEDGTYHLHGHKIDDHDKWDLSRLELAAVLADFDPAPTEDTTP